MSLPVGSIRTEVVITVHVPENFVMTSAGKRYVFIVHIQPKIFDACKVAGNMKPYQNYIKARRNDMYNVVSVYGLDAVDIDNPHLHNVSSKLSIKIVKKGTKMPAAIVEFDKKQ